MKSRSALLFSSLLFSLIMSHGAHAQEFSLVGDWANKDESSDWWGFIPTQAQWERIDSLQLNWLKVILEQVDPPNTTTSEDILLHQPAHGSYRYLVDRMSPGTSPYQKCNNNNRKSVSTFLGRYIMGSFLVRLQLSPDGRELRRLADGYRSRGTLALPIDLSGFPSGVYLCSIQAAGYRGTIQRIVTCR